MLYVRNLCSSSYVLLIVPQYLSKANFHSRVALPVGRLPRRKSWTIMKSETHIA